MKNQKRNYLAIGFILNLAILVNVIMISHNTLDFQIHDTYIVISKFHFTLLIIGPLTFFLFLWISISNGFKNLISNLGLIAGTISIILIMTNVLIVLQGFE